jgi:hypothetical protein
MNWYCYFVYEPKRVKTTIPKRQNTPACASQSNPT